MPHVNIAAAGTTKAPRKTTTSSANRDGPLGVLPAPATKDGLDDNHIRGRRRMFIGPMPENVAARLRAAPALSAQGNGTLTSTNGFAPEDFAHDDIADNSDSSSSCSGSRECSGSESDVPEEVERGPNRVSRKRLLRAFLSKGGNREQFSEREIRRRWRAGGWSRVPLPPDASARRWVGTSFEVGVDVVAGMSENARQVAVSHPLRDAREGGEGASNLGRAPVASRTTTAETFVTARSSTGPKSDEEESEEEPDVKPRLEPVNTSVAPPKSPSLGPSQSGEPSSRATSATHKPDTPVSTSPLLSPRAPKDTVRPHSTLGIPNITLANSTGAPQTVSESHLPGALTSQKRSSLASKDTGLRSALRRNFSILKRGSTQQRSVVFAESPQPLSDNAPDPFNKLPHSASAPAFPSRQPVTNRVPSDSPARPIEVLNREAEPADTTSAGAAVALQAQQNRVPDDGIILRDRMLVRAAFNRSPGLPKPFDEAEARRHPDTQEVQWREMLVVWRRNRNGEDRVELYQDYTTPGKERILGHKDLAFVVPLSEAATSISLYSHVDLTFCLTCPPTPVRTGSPSKRARFHRAPIGTNIFVCKVKSRTRALNWIWNLWRYLGGELPETIDIHCPALGTRVRVDIPDLDRAAAGDSWKRFTRPYLIEACGRSLRGLPDWDAMMESPVLRGARLELAWRKESKLDWVWQETDEQGMEIDWQVLFGLALRQPSLPSQLEIRLGLHSPTHVSLTDGTILEEPLAVEGYLHRIKPKTLTRTNVYLTSHDGYLFTLRYADAEPPTPPVLFQAPLDDVGHRAARERELRRGRCMILDADGYIDLRSIMAIRRAVELTPPIGTIDIGVTRSNRLASDSAHDEEFDDQWVDQEDASDNEDEGGEDYLSKSDDKMRLKMKRSFELIMRSGRVVRFETYSRKTCLEWIARLRDLTKYWTRRHRVDARDEMELVFATQGRARFTIPKLGQEEAPEGWVPDGASPYLAKFWNWCVLEGCRVIVKAGRLYTKTGIRKQFKHDFHVLTGGHIMLFHITPNAASYHRHSQTINLADAYVYSGQIAMRSLPRAAGVDSRQKIPRRYQDGLESDDSEEDTTFIIWYRPHSTHKPLDPLLPSNPNSKGDPLIAPLSGKHKTLICKARSRLERDAWCWVLNTEIERLSRTQLAREKNMRNQGTLVPE